MTERIRRVGLIGFGSIAEHGHLPAWQSFPETHVVAVADVSPERLVTGQALLPQAVLYDDAFKLIERAEVDAIDICAPPNTHADLIVAACERGISQIVCEKPLVLTEEEYTRIARSRERSGSRVVSVNNWMHSDLNRHVRAVLSAGSIGRIQCVELRTGRPDAARGHGSWMPHWRTDIKLAGGGIILDHGWHQLYLLLGWVRQPIVSVRAETRTVEARHLPVEDEAKVDILFPGAQGHIQLSWTSRTRSNEGRIEGTLGSIDIHDDRITANAPEGMQDLIFCGKLTQSSYHPDWFKKMLRYNVIDENRTEADRNFSEAGVIVSAICAAYRSAGNGGIPLAPIALTHATPSTGSGRKGGNH